jgi:hypothetical protein
LEWIFLLLVTGLCGMYYYDKNAQEVTIPKEKINGILITSILSSLVANGIISELKINDKKNISLKELEDLFLNEGQLTCEHFKDFCLHHCHSIQKEGFDHAFDYYL